MTRAKTAAPDKGADDQVTVTVRSTGFRRYRAGLGPFGRDPVTLEVSREQLIELRSDTLLIVEEV